MKIGIISDSHDNLLMINRAVELFKDENISLILHAGDHVAPFTVEPFLFSGLEVQAIFGNNDGDRPFLKKRFMQIGGIYDGPREFIIQGKKILLMHEPDTLNETARSGRYDLVIFGHTHFLKNYMEGDTMVLNPGEACGWITGRATAMTLDMSSWEVKEHLLGTSPMPPLNGNAIIKQSKKADKDEK